MCVGSFDPFAVPVQSPPPYLPEDPTGRFGSVHESRFLHEHEDYSG
jgi:hypothetical protein